MKPEFCCLVPVTSFCEPTDTADPVTGKKVWRWFAIDDSRPLFAFAGIWCTWHGLRGTQKAPEQGEYLLYGFLTTAPNAVVAPVHSKAMPAILRSIEECDAWLTAEPARSAQDATTTTGRRLADRGYGGEGGPAARFGFPSGDRTGRTRITTMTDLIDIYRAAKVVIDRDGADAQLYAAVRTVVLAGEGDEEGAAIWRQIAAAVEELQRERRPDEAVN